ncbi:MAG TPA: Gfo/Idh/MocA family oxidoreductase [Armatimonadetes bacterium]|jgi:predicted dehydrogenase|nr:Gfo/Idh/MocA family oxidoreductase [Armatimonadota bacterium]
MNIGIIGLGFMGSTHFRAVQQVPGARVSALCDSIQKRLDGDWRDIRGNIGESAGIVDLSGINKYLEVDKFLADPEIDLVDVCLPTPFHRDIAIRAMEAGKHVLVEKPIALTLEDADAMVEASRRTGKKLMVGQVVRFFPEFDFVKQTVAGGEYGALLGVHLKRVISKPSWSAGGWFNDAKQTGGIVLDLHIHDSDFIRHLIGTPDAVQCSGVVSPGGEVVYIAAQYLFEGRNVTATANSGAIASPTVVFEQGYDVYLEKATIRYNSQDEAPVTLYTDEGKQAVDLKKAVGLASPDGWVNEIAYAVKCLSEGKEPELLAGQSARDSMYLCLKELESVATGKPVKVK